MKKILSIFILASLARLDAADSGKKDMEIPQTVLNDKQDTNCMSFIIKEILNLYTSCSVEAVRQRIKELVNLKIEEKKINDERRMIRLRFDSLYKDLVKWKKIIVNYETRLRQLDEEYRILDNKLMYFGIYSSMLSSIDLLIEKLDKAYLEVLVFLFE